MFPPETQMFLYFFLKIKKKHWSHKEFEVKDEHWNTDFSFYLDLMSGCLNFGFANILFQLTGSAAQENEPLTGGKVVPTLQEKHQGTATPYKSVSWFKSVNKHKIPTHSFSPCNWPKFWKKPQNWNERND